MRLPLNKLNIYLVLCLTGVNGHSATTNNKNLLTSVRKENVKNNFRSKVHVLSEPPILNVNTKANDYINMVLQSISNKLLPEFLKVNIFNDSVQIFLETHKQKGRNERGLSSKTQNIMQYMLIPSFLMAGILPWIMPKLQMMVMAVSMLNNMVFGNALFNLVRSFIFEKHPDEHIIYLNHGYRDKSHSEEYLPHEDFPETHNSHNHHGHQSQEVKHYEYKHPEKELHGYEDHSYKHLHHVVNPDEHYAHDRYSHYR